jgi:hypothetical protein
MAAAALASTCRDSAVMEDHYARRAAFCEIFTATADDVA